jgi:hypothetical protein
MCSEWICEKRFGRKPLNDFDSAKLVLPVSFITQSMVSISVTQGADFELQCLFLISNQVQNSSQILRRDIYGAAIKKEATFL